MNNNVNELFPIGTVVLLNNGSKRLMIFGINQTIEGASEYDYIGVPYPEGNMGQDFQYLFNHNDIKEVFFRGYEDVERQEFIINLQKYYDEKETLE